MSNILEYIVKEKGKIKHTPKTNEQKQTRSDFMVKPLSH